MRKPKQPDRKQPQQQRKPNDLSHCLAVLDSDHTLVAVVELSLSNWLVAGVVPGVERQPLKKLKPEPGALLELLHRWRLEAERSGREITRIAVAYEAGCPRRLLAGTLVDGAWRGDLCYSSSKHCRVARASSGQDRSS